MSSFFFTFSLSLLPLSATKILSPLPVLSSSDLSFLLHPQPFIFLWWSSPALPLDKFLGDEDAIFPQHSAQIYLRVAAEYRESHCKKAIFLLHEQQVALSHPTKKEYTPESSQLGMGT